MADCLPTLLISFHGHDVYVVAGNQAAVGIPDFTSQDCQQNRESCAGHSI